MRKNFLRTIVAAGLLMLVSAAARAQSADSIGVHVPFDFGAGKGQLEAGDYTARFVAHNLVVIRSADGRRSIGVAAPRAVEAGDARAVERLVFRRYGDRYFLAQVWTRRGGGGRELYVSEGERRLIKEIKTAGQEPAPETVTVAARKK